MRRFLFLFVGLLTALPAWAVEIKPFTASYTADWSQLPMSGSASRVLKQLSDGSWQLEFEASMMVSGLTETSIFTMVDDTITPIKYRYKRSGIGGGDDKNIFHDFDWKAMQATGKERGKLLNIQLPNKGILDKSTYQLALQHDVAEGKKNLSYQVLDVDEIDTYDFRVLGEEMVKTGVGKLAAIKLERVRDPSKSKRKTIIWLAKDWNYMLVALYQMEKDGKGYTITLNSGQVDGKAVKGK